MSRTNSIRARAAHAKARLDLVKLNGHIFELELELLTNRAEPSSYRAELKLAHEQLGSQL